MRSRDSDRVLRPLPMPRERCLHEAGKERMRRVRLRLELRMILHGDKPGVIGDLDDLDELSIGMPTGGDHAVRFEFLEVVGIEFVAMPMAFRDLQSLVTRKRSRLLAETARLRTQPHRSPFLGHAFLFFEQADDGIGRIGSELFAFWWPRTLRANSITAACIPRQIPK